jgi:histidine triad (HIT) family protein
MTVEKLYENEHVMAFPDINPQAPVHALVIPKKHISTLNDLQDGDRSLMGELFLGAKTLANDLQIAQPGYRCVINCNAGAGQSVFHIHLHVLGGRSMRWPPG